MITPIPLGTVGYAEGRLPNTCFLIQSDDANILVNTGVGNDDDDINSRHTPDCQDIAAALESAAGMGTDRIDIVINTSLGFDHCGNNPVFDRPPVYVQTPEYDEAMGGQYTVTRWFNPMVVHYQQLNGDYQLTDHVRVLATPGFSPGQQSVLVEHSGKTSLIVGRAVLDADEYDRQRNQPHPFRGARDEAAYLESVKRLLELNANTVWFCHGDAPWQANG